MNNLAEKLDLNYLEKLTANFQEQETVAFHNRVIWSKQARSTQIEPQGNWSIWLILAGRGWGKTRTGAENILTYAMQRPNSICGVVAPTSGDLRRVCFEGPSGLLKLVPRECLIDTGKAYNRSAMELRLWNGSVIQGYAAIEPDRLRGPQFHRIWADEMAAWRYSESFDQMMFGLRLGDNPKLVITTTPRPTKIITDLIERKGKDVFVQTGSTFDNKDNLAESALQQLRDKYEGTTLGRQELFAEVLTDVEGALWHPKLIEVKRLKQIPDKMQRIVISVDPAVTNNEGSDETGIIVSGKGFDNRYYILEDLSARMSADTWAKTVVEAFYKYEADRVIAEVNNGGDLVERLLRTVDASIPYKAVRASKGKLVRAEPISALYEQGKVSHIGYFAKLEDQMCSFTIDSRRSPDRLDALVWGLTELSKSSGQAIWRVT
jgi:predicted phage terminase large subunit-like protein